MFTYKPEKIHRIILKLSGEVLAGEKGFGFDDAVIDRLTDDIIDLRKIGLSCGIVLGGGNFFRGGTWKNKSLDRVVLDNIGMLATIQNALYLSEILRKKNYSTDVFSAIKADKIAKYYTPIRVETAFQEGRICFLCGGTGNPFFTTDTAAVLRAIELNADIVLKGTKVNGVYSDDPITNPKAEFYANISYDEVLKKELKVMDLTAFSLAKENNIPIKVFNINAKGSMKDAVLVRDSGTYIHR
ncbi:MAG TPA: UMP kinase [Candidatus Cloacimonadota bacterium]|nr:UMP kinase [Candidatus Cloacimonadota bacterium]HPT71212.1 UMP kinase [Candidatus Cloacimonadota bacterium]